MVAGGPSGFVSSLCLVGLFPLSFLHCLLEEGESEGEQSCAHVSETKLSGISLASHTGVLIDRFPHSSLSFDRCTLSPSLCTPHTHSLSLSLHPTRTLSRALFVFPASLPRSKVNDLAGAKSPMPNLIAAAVILLATLWVGPAVAPVPKAVMAAIVINAIIKIVYEPMEVRRCLLSAIRVNSCGIPCVCCSLIG